MSLKRGYLIDQIEKYTELLGWLVAGRKIVPGETTIDQALADLTGLPEDFFKSVSDPAILYSVLTMVPTDDQKALAALLLWHKDPSHYPDTAKSLLTLVDKSKLDPRVKEFISQKSI
jgi:hypothetical protein